MPARKKADERVPVEKVIMYWGEEWTKSQLDYGRRVIAKRRVVLDQRAGIPRSLQVMSRIGAVLPLVACMVVVTLLLQFNRWSNAHESTFVKMMNGQPVATSGLFGGGVLASPAPSKVTLTPDAVMGGLMHMPSIATPSSTFSSDYLPVHAGCSCGCFAHHDLGSSLELDAQGEWSCVGQ